MRVLTPIIVSLVAIYVELVAVTSPMIVDDSRLLVYFLPIESNEVKPTEYSVLDPLLISMFAKLSTSLMQVNVAVSFKQSVS